MLDDFRITLLYDNHRPEIAGLRASWGFSCLIEGFDKTILFDTGTSGPILLKNMATLNISPKDVDAVILSHGDWDHIGGLWSFLDVNPDVEVYLPKSFSRHFKDEIRNYGAIPVVVDSNKLSVCNGITLSGEMEAVRNEQSMLVESPWQRIVITGCAHPGIVPIVKQLISPTPGLPVLVMGGFHLKDAPAKQIKRVVSELQEMGVLWAAPIHCSGERAQKYFADEFGKHYISLIPGSVLSKDSMSN